jgi:hypothetical protein
MPASKAQRATTAQRRTEAVGLKLAGLDYQTIADRLGYASRGAAHTDITRAMEAGLAEQHREVELVRFELLARLNRLQAAIWPDALRGDPKAADVALKIIDRIAKLVGADAAVRHEVVTWGAVEEEIARLSKELGEADRGVPIEPSSNGLVGGPEAGPAA